MTVCIIDDDASMRGALQRLLRAADLAPRAYGSVGDYLLDPLPDEAPGCLLVDVYLPGPSGLDLQAALQRGAHPRPMVFMSGSADVPTSVRAMRGGAVDFLTKPIERDALLAALHRALELDAARRRDARALGELQSRHASLTPRERDVFDAVAAGRLNKQIAADLGVCERTVKAHRAGVMAKFGAATAADLGRIAERLRATGA